MKNMSNELAKPIIYQIDDNEAELNKLEDELKSSESNRKREIILDYPTVYIHNWQNTGDVVVKYFCNTIT